jgi:uncharacterized membrane protein
MESRLKVAGNPIYPMLVMFPFGLLVTGLIFDAADVLGGPALLGTVGYWHAVAGIVGGICAGAVGMVDLLATRDGSRARRLAVTYALTNLAVLLAFTVVVMARLGNEGRAAGGGLLVVEAVVLLTAVLTAACARQLTDRLATGAVPLPRLRALAERLR